MLTIMVMTLDNYLITSGLTNREFSLKIGVSEVTVSRWRRGRRNFPPPKLMEKIMEESSGAITPMDWFEQWRKA